MFNRYLHFIPRKNFLLTIILSSILVSSVHAVTFSTSDVGVPKGLSHWAIGWVGNTQQNIERMGGAANIDTVRIGCPKEWALDSNNQLVPDAIAEVDTQMAKALLVTSANPNAKIAMVCSGGNGINAWYIQNNGVDIRGTRWLSMFKAVKNYVGSTYGLDFAYIEVANEQDFNQKKGTKQNINNIMAKFKADPEMGIYPQVGPSTLSTATAMNWYQPTKGNTDWGATHAISGGAKKYINFVQTVNADGKSYYGSEIHNLVEMIMSEHYGGIGGLWWHSLSVNEGLFSQYCQQGNRIFYKEKRSTFSAMSAYRGAEPRTIHVFAASKKGESFNLNVSNRDVFFNGVGPQRSYVVNIEKNRDAYVKITW